MPLDALKPNLKNPREHNRKQIDKLALAIGTYGFTNPILADEVNRIIAGHARYLAARQLGLISAPVIRIAHLSDAQKMALAISDNALGDCSSWDDQLLGEALAKLEDLEFDLDLTGLETGKIDFYLDGAAGSRRADPADIVEPPAAGRPAVSRNGDLWCLGSHRLLCGDALRAASYECLLGSRRAQLVWADPPYNVAVEGHVTGLGRNRHREFAMASGEMSQEQFRRFLAAACTHMAAFSVDGSIHYLCMDWRHIGDLLAAGETVYFELKNIVAWVKSNAGMGSLYRSQHELVAVFKNGTAPHINNVELGKHGRARSNVWDYPGANAFGPTRDDDLAAHPTIKPIAMVADAIRDCSKRGGIVLDPFAGSGTTILACDRSGRRAAAMEIDPLYVDVAVRRWQAATGEEAVLAGDRRTFNTLARTRQVLALEDFSNREVAQ